MNFFLLLNTKHDDLSETQSRAVYMNWTLNINNAMYWLFLYPTVKTFALYKKVFTQYFLWRWDDEGSVICCHPTTCLNFPDSVPQELTLQPQLFHIFSALLLCDAGGVHLQVDHLCLHRVIVSLIQKVKRVRKTS